MRPALVGALALSAALVSSRASAQPAPKAPGAAAPKAPAVAKTPVVPPFKIQLGPYPASDKPGTTHGPFEAGDCSLCHKNADPKNPGPLARDTTGTCLGCHDEFEKVLARRFKHGTVGCTACHNPHNAKQRKLLVAESTQLCNACHAPIGQLMAGAKVKHDAMTHEKACLNCHNPHASNIEHLLIRMPFDLCVNCHSKDEMADNDGKKLTNFKRWLDANPVWHAPVASKDCSACHLPHGGDKFRLLVSDYPAEFYAPYDPKNYQLCFECHNPKILSEPETTTLTKFRDGARNLHYLHVNKPDNGRTCRACHEVHAARQPHHIRDAVPYGSKRWMLPINYTPSPSGGSCEKTCHSRKEYDNGGGRGVAATKPAAPKAK